MEKVLRQTVCFFDSGIGGICLLYECVRRLPCVDFIYFSDNANVPYGSLPQDKLIKLADKYFGEIARYNPSAAVIACNTVTARCIDYVRKRFAYEIIGIQPAIKPAAKAGSKCLVLATPSTVESEPLHMLIDTYGLGKTQAVACPDLAKYIEDNIDDLDENYIFSRLPDVDCDCVVLGCTHYIYIKEIVQKRYGCEVFDGVEGTCANLMRKLGAKEDLLSRAQSVTFKGDFAAKNKKVFDSLILKNGLKLKKTT